MTGYLPAAVGWKISARRTTPSSMVMGTSQSMRNPSRISLFAPIGSPADMISGICRAMAFDRLGVGGIGAHVDAAFPFSFQWIGNLQRHLADVLDLDLDRLAVLKRPEALVVGAAGNEIPRIHSHHRRSELDKLWHPMFHVIGAVVVTQLTIIPEAHDQVVRVLDLVGGRDAGA